MPADSGRASTRPVSWQLQRAAEPEPPLRPAWRGANSRRLGCPSLKTVAAEPRCSSGRLPIKCVNHLSLVCSNVSASVAFYRNVLGFILVKRPLTFNETFEGAWLWGYGIGLHLIAGQPVPRSAHIDPRSDHLSFQTDALQEVADQLCMQGIPFLRQTVVEDGVEVQQIFCHDADNNMIEFCNCDCLPVIPIEPTSASTLCNCQPAIGSKDDDELTSRNSLDSCRSIFT